MPPSTSRVQVFDPETARLLATGREHRAVDADGFAFECERGNGTLLTYYFGKGKRRVVVRTGPNEGVTASLGTRWVNGHREWTLDW